MLKLILGAAALTALPLLAFQQFGLPTLPTLPAPVQLLGKSGRVVLLESVRLASAEPVAGRLA
jgi:hypothetical protein